MVDGQIRFVPKPGTVAPLVIEAITDGRYDTPTSDGVPVGHYRVEIRSYDPDTSPPKGPGDPQRTQFLPPKYNRQTELELTIPPGSDPLTKDYHLN